MTTKTKAYCSAKSISRDGNKFTAKASTTSAQRKVISKVRVQWAVTGKSDARTKELSKSGGSSTLTITRKNWYPCTYKSGKKTKERPKLKAVKFRAMGTGVSDSEARKHGGASGWTGWQTFTLAKPAAPSVSASVNADTGTVTFTIKTDDPDSGKRERYDTEWEITQEASKKSLTAAKGTGTSTSESFTKSRDVAAATSLADGQWVKVSCRARARGLAGDSKWSATESHTFARPKKPTNLKAKVYGDASTGYVIVSFELSETGTYPVDSVQLQRLQSEVGTATEAANASGWEDVEGSTDDAQVKGLSDTRADATPVAAGTHVWYRVAATHDNLTTYSTPVECKGLYVKKSTTAAGKVTLATKGAGDGWVELSITDSQTDDDCVRITWSDDEDAWESTEQPESFDVDWLASGKATVYVRGLDNGTRYYFRARAVDKDSDGNEVLGGLSATVDATPSSDYGTVTLTAPESVRPGDDLDVSWSFSSDMTQESAYILVNGSAVARVAGVGTVATVPAAVLEKYAGETVLVVARVMAGDTFFDSEISYIVVADPPAIGLTAGALTAQPMAFELTTDSANSPTVTASVTAQGFSGTGLDGDFPQYEGECVWSGTLAPEWAEGDGGDYTATATIPGGLTFWDGCSYVLTATLEDPVTGLSSDTATADFEVVWAHQAGQPVGTATADSDALSASVRVDAPSSYERGDRFDLYRVTADGGRRIASSLPFGSTVTDRLAPFGEGPYLRYLAVTRTADGDWAESDPIEYGLSHGALRFDWGTGDGRSLDLPYNIASEASVDKGAESHTALDGSSARSETLTSSLVRLDSADDEEAVLDMAGYPGPVFVRTPEGQAFEANVTLDKESWSHDSREKSLSIKCKEVTALSGEHMPGAADISLPQWGQGEVDVSDSVVYDARGGFPMDGWGYCGTCTDGTVYVVDENGTVRDGSGAEMTGYTWDGMTVYNADGLAIVMEG